MAAPDTLIETLAYLQQHVSVAHNRHVLLDYARKSARGRLGLLFRVDSAAQQLVVVEQCGSAPRQEQPLQIMPVPLNGLFSVALHQHGALRIYDAYSDPRSLPEERSWTWRGGRVLLCAIGAGSTRPGSQGVMALCSGTDTTDTTDTIDTSKMEQAHSEILICAALLGAYLEDEPKEIRAAVDRERNRIARDIHDGAAQGIAHAIHSLEFAQRLLENQPQAAQREISRARETLRASLNELRHDIATLLPAQLEQGNFAEAVRALLADFRMQEPAISLRYEEAPIKHLPPSLEVPLYRFLQEALNNARKHAQASHIAVQIQSLPGLLVAQVSDDGAGFSVEQVRRQQSKLARFGLHAMQERIEQAGGMLDIVSKPGAGTTLKARFPLALPPVALTKREHEVLRLLADGATNRIIADSLSVSIETVKSHVHHIMQKLQVKDRTQAAVLAARKQWV